MSEHEECSDGPAEPPAVGDAVKVELGAGTGLVPGARVRHVDDDRVRSKILKLLKDPLNGKLLARCEGIGNLISVDLLVVCEEPEGEGGGE